MTEEIRNEVQPEVGSFRRSSIPLVRRIYPQLIAADIVNVQPLQGPASLLYYLRYQYSSNRGSRGENQDFPTRRYRVSEIRHKVDWKTEGF